MYHGKSSVLKILKVEVNRQKFEKDFKQIGRSKTGTVYQPNSVLGGVSRAMRCARFCTFKRVTPIHGGL